MTFTGQLGTSDSTLGNIELGAGSVLPPPNSYIDVAVRIALWKTDDVVVNVTLKKGIDLAVRAVLGKALDAALRICLTSKHYTDCALRIALTATKSTDVSLLLCLTTTNRIAYQSRVVKL